MSYKKALQILENLENKTLICGTYNDGHGGVCALGALVPNLEKLPTASSLDEAIRAKDEPFQETSINDLARILPEVAERLNELNLTSDEAFILQEVNDTAPDIGRWTTVVMWLRERVEHESPKEAEKAQRETREESSSGT